MAAKDLANLIGEPLENIGVLSGTIMNTGTISRTTKFARCGLTFPRGSLNAAERGEVPMIVGRGQLLFMVRQATRVEASRLKATGYRFAALSNIVQTLAHSIEVTCDELLPQLEKMQVESSGDQSLDPGVHLACFALRPVLHNGFDVFVRGEASNLLPTIFLKRSKLEQYQLDMLERMDNLAVISCIDILRERRLSNNRQEHLFAGELLEGILQLSDSIDHPWFSDARLVARPRVVPCNPLKQHVVHQQAFLVTFRIMVDAHQDFSLFPRFRSCPLNFFQCQQHAYTNSPDNAVFGRKINQEFGELLKPYLNDYTFRNSTADPHHYRSRSSSETYDMMSPTPRKKKSWSSRMHLNGFSATGNNTSKTNLVDRSKGTSQAGMKVSKEIDIDIGSMNHERRSSEVEMSTLTGATTADTEEESFADELFNITVNERKKPTTPRE